jgi:vitamin B12 transporter
MSIRQSFLITIVFALYCTSLHAQTDSSLDGPDTIVVSASRSPLERPRVGSAITVITRDQIQLRQARYVTDVLRSVPGFSVTQTGTIGSQTQVRVRGAEANHVLVLIDGIRANDPATGDEFRWEYLTTGDVERIEVVRGPQSSLWGSDAVAAVVNIITRSGNAAPQLAAYAEGGSNESMNGGINGGTGGDNWSLGFGLEQLETGGTNISRTGDEKDGSDVLTASFSGDVNASDRLAINFGIRVVDASTDVDPTDYLVTGLPVDGDIVNEGTRTYLQAGTTLQGKIRHQASVRYLDTTNENLVSGAKDSSTEANRLTFTYQADIALQNDMLSIALEREDTDFRQRGAVDFGDPNQDQEMSVSSFVADYQHHASDSLTWLLSARYDDNSDFASVVTGRISVAWQLSDATRIRANIGTGQKAPTFIERFGYFPGQFVGNPNLKPETSTSYDFGFDHQFAGDAMTFGITLFRQDLEDEINGFVFDPGTFLSTAENRSEDSDRKGIEVEALLKVSDSLELGGSYTYTDSSETNAGITTRELRRPRHAGHLNAVYRVPGRTANITLAADYGGTRSDIFFAPFPEPSEIITLANFWLVDLTATYDLTEKLDVFVRVNNLLDEDYEQVYGFATPGRSAYVGLRATFGQ